MIDISKFYCVCIGAHPGAWDRQRRQSLFTPCYKDGHKVLQTKNCRNNEQTTSGAPDNDKSFGLNALSHSLLDPLRRPLWIGNPKKLEGEGS